MALIMSRAALCVVALVLLSGCSPKLRLEVFNNTQETMVVSYWKNEVTIAPESVGVLDVRLGNSKLTVKTGSIDGDYEIDWSGLAGYCYRPGLRHTVKLQIDSVGVLFVLKNDQEFLASGGGCGQYQIAQ